jgi:LysM repeat protein
MAEPACHYCDRPAEEQCPTCGRLYCYEHGDDVCVRCLAPESATPGSLMYRGSLMALVLASLVAVFLFLRPPESKSAAGTVLVVATATVAQSPTATPTPQGRTPTPGATAKSTANATAGASVTANAGTATTGKTYTVVSGDTLGGIAVAHGTTLEGLEAANPGITPDNLPIGTVLKLP